MDKQYDVFISYGRRDYEMEYQENGETVKKLIPNNPILQIVDALRGAGITCWYDQDGVSSDFLKYIKQKIDSSRVMIFVSSQYSNQSEYTPDEIARAKQLRMQIIAFKIDKTEFNDDFSLGLASKNTIDIFMTNPKKALADLVKCVQKSLEQVRKKEAEQLRKKQEEERRAEEARKKKEQEERRLKEMNEKKTKLQEIQKQLLKTRNQCKELEQEEKSLIEIIKQLEAPTPIPTPRKYTIIALIVICLSIIVALIWIFIPRESKLTVSTHEMVCSYRDTSVCIGVSSNKEWFIYPSQGSIFTAVHKNDTTMSINIQANKDSVARVDYIAVLTKDRKNRETITLRQERAPKPIVQFISEPRVERNVVKNNEHGVYIHVKLSTKYLKDVPCTLVARFYNSDGKAIKSNNETYSIYGNLVSEMIDLTPLNEDTQKDYALFIPNSELPKAPGRRYYFFVHLCVKSSQQELAKTPISEIHS